MKENKYLEFQTHLNDDFLKTVSAYANYGNGQIIFSMNDIDIKDSKLIIEKKINDNINPIPEYSIIEDRNNIVLNVYEGEKKPYFYNNRAYKRSKTSSIEIDMIELRRLIMANSNISFEELKSKEQNLTFNYLVDILERKIGISKFNEDILLILGLMDKDKNYNNAAYILSDQNKMGIIDIVKFGDNIHIFKERVILSEMSLLKAIEQAIEVYKRYYTYEEVTGMERKLIEMIPEKAFREVLCNAAISRVFDEHSNIQIAMFDDYLEITSPVSLPSNMDIDKYINGNSLFVGNPIITNIFYRLKLIENFGTSIIKTKQAYRNSFNKPEFKITDNFIKVKLPVLNYDNILKKKE